MNNSFSLSSHIVSRITTATALTALLVWLPACNKAAQTTAAAPSTPAATAPAQLSTDEQKVSYGVGFNMGSAASRQGGFKIDQSALRAGFEDGLASAKTRIPETDIEAAFQAVQQRMASAAAAEGEKQLAAGAAYLEKNKARAGVTTTASGLQYEVLKSGSGPKATASNTVIVHYHGTLIDGTVFDSSVDRGETAEFAVTGVISGWVEALQLMSVGDKWKLFVPANLGYGARGKGKISPNSMLIFELELLEIK